MIYKENQETCPYLLREYQVTRVPTGRKITLTEKGNRSIRWTLPDPPYTSSSGTISSSDLSCPWVSDYLWEDRGVPSFQRKVPPVNEKSTSSTGRSGSGWTRYSGPSVSTRDYLSVYLLVYPCNPITGWFRSQKSLLSVGHTVHEDPSSVPVTN